MNNKNPQKITFDATYIDKKTNTKLPLYDNNYYPNTDYLQFNIELLNYNEEKFYKKIRRNMSRAIQTQIKRHLLHKKGNLQLNINNKYQINITGGETL